MGTTYDVDGTNVCWWYGQSHRDETSILPLLTVLLAILKNGDHFYCVFDASTPSVLGEQGKGHEADALKSLQAEYPSLFFQVTGSTRADGVLLHDADHYGRSIITNDKYRDYEHKYEWLAERHTPRLIQGNLQPSGLMTIDKLAYGGLSLETDASRSIEELRSLLCERASPELVEIAQKIEQKKRELEELTKQHEKREEAETSEFRELTKKIKRTREEEQKLNRAVKELSAKKKAAEDDTKKAKQDLAKLKKEAKSSRKKIAELHDMEDADSVISEMRTQLSELTKNISSSKRKLSSLQRKCEKHREESNRIDNESAAHKIELADDGTCIEKTQKALYEFLEPYYRNHRCMIPFEGSSWEAAVESLKVFFQHNAVCPNCYYYNGPLFFGGECPMCGSPMARDSKKIWKIVNKHAPRRGFFGAMKNAFR
jgi:hypothetical protein